MINDPNYPSILENEHDDLPRTLRRERDAREREKREREMREAAPSLSTAPPHGMGSAGMGAPGMGMSDTAAYASPIEVEAPPARVTAFDVPFGHLVTFFLKAALAAIPALLLLTVLLWLAGHLVQTFLPQLVKMQILIRFPDNT